MKAFIDDIITFLNGKYASETILSKKPTGRREYGDTPTSTTPFFTVQTLDYSSADEDFSNETIISAPIQINVYGVEMNINSIKQNAQVACEQLAELCIEYMEQYKNFNTQLRSMRRASVSPIMPYDFSKKTYFCALRYDVLLKAPFVANANNNNN